MTDKQIKLIKDTSSEVDNNVNANEIERLTLSFQNKFSPVPEDLMHRTLRAMEQKEQEITVRKKARRFKVITAAVAAAVITIILTVTPVRGYVVTAAEKALASIQSWAERVFGTDEPAEDIAKGISSDKIIPSYDSTTAPDISIKEPTTTTTRKKPKKRKPVSGSDISESDIP